ncbi:MAG: hypothetical protein AAFU75_07410, partial [Planctomycetota bacterium]
STFSTLIGDSGILKDSTQKRDGIIASKQANDQIVMISCEERWPRETATWSIPGNPQKESFPSTLSRLILRPA